MSELWCSSAATFDHSPKIGLRAPSRFDGGLVLAFRLELARGREGGHRIAVVDLDEDYVPQGTPLVIEPATVSYRRVGAWIRAAVACEV